MQRPHPLASHEQGDHPLAPSTIATSLPPAASAGGPPTPSCGGPAQQPAAGGTALAATTAVEQFLGRSFQWRKPTEQTVSADMKGLDTLATSGAWHATIKLADRLVGSAQPHHRLLIRLYKMVALLKVRQFRVAVEEMASMGDAEAEEYQFERHAELYPDRTGSMVPFALHILRAQLPYYMGDTATALDALLALVARCDSARQLREGSRAHAAASAGLGGAEEEGPTETGFDHPHNERAAKLALANLHIVRGDVELAIALLSELAARRADDLALMSMLGRLHLQLGDVSSAEDVFDRLECAVPDCDASGEVRTNRGFFAMAQGNYALARDEFDAALASGAPGVVAANNRAVCSLYLCQLTDAVASLEEFLRTDPVAHLQPTLVSNLFALYELQSDHAAVHRRAIEQLAALVAPDDFDLRSYSAGGGSVS